MTPSTLAHTDQYQAATRDALTRLHHLAQLARQPVRHRAASDWLADRIEALSISMRAGTTRPCHHLGASPQVAHVALWAPQHVMCDRCVSELHPDGTEDSTCDRCRHQVDLIRPCLVALGPLLLHFGLCTPCHAATLTREDRSQ